MHVRITLGVLCTAIGRANPTFSDVYDGSSGEQHKMWQKLFHEGIHELFERFFPLNIGKINSWPLLMCWQYVLYSVLHVPNVI